MISTPRRLPARKYKSPVLDQDQDSDQDSEQDSEQVALGPIIDPNQPVIYLHGTIDALMASRFIGAVSELDNNSKVSLAIVDINSEGGDLDALNSILTTMRGANTRLATFVRAEASSAAAVILSAGTAGLRYASPHSYVMLHGMSVGCPLETLEDVNNRIAFLKNQNDRMLDFVAKNCGKTLAKLKKIFIANGSRDLYLTPQAALEFGIIDVIGIPKLSMDLELTIKAVV